MPCPPPPPPWTPGLQLLMLYALYLGRPQGSARPPVPAATLTWATPMVCSLEQLRALRGPPCLGSSGVDETLTDPQLSTTRSPRAPIFQLSQRCQPLLSPDSGLGCRSYIPVMSAWQASQQRPLKPSGILRLWTQVCLGPQHGPRSRPGRHTECSLQATSGLMQGPCGQTRLWGPSPVGVHMVPGPPATGAPRGL